MSMIIEKIVLLETHSRDTLETVTSTDIDLLKPSVKECLMEALSIFIENVVDSLGRDKRYMN